MITKTTKIYIDGNRDMVGSSDWLALEAKGYFNLIGKTITKLDLRNQQAVDGVFSIENQEVIIDTMAKVGVKLKFRGKGVDEKANVISCSDDNY